MIPTIASFIISVLVLNFSVLPIKQDSFISTNRRVGFLNIFNRSQGRVLGTVEENIGQLARKTAEEILIKASQAKDASIASLTKKYSPNGLPNNQNNPIIISSPSSPPEISAKGAIVIDNQSNSLLFKNNIHEVLPIASITKLMTALVFLEHNPGWETIYKIKREDRREGGKIYLYLGEKVTVKDLFYLSLVGSANTATMALVNSTGLSEEEFINKMDAKAQDFGLRNTKFYDPIGLNNYNVSTAWEITQLAKTALANKDIRQATLTQEYKFNTITGKVKRVATTDHLLKFFPENGMKIIGGKTGYIDLAGYCFVGQFINSDGQEIIAVVLNSETNSQRFKETKDLAQWAYENYIWPVVEDVFLRQGEDDL